MLIDLYINIVFLIPLEILIKIKKLNFLILNNFNQLLL